MSNTPTTIPVGAKVKFASERNRYTVQASDGRFAVCTRPFNLRKTVFYTIIDFEKQVRGPENLVFGHGAETRERCEEMLVRLTRLECRSEVSQRHGISIDIERIDLEVKE